MGNRYWEWSFLGFAYPAFVLGDWDDVVAREEGLPDEDWVQARIAFSTFLTSIVPVHIHRGKLEDAKRSARLFAELEGSADYQEQSQVHCAEAALLLAEGNYAEALRSAEASLATRHAMGISFEAVRESFVIAVEAALALDDVPRVEQLLSVVDSLPPGGAPPFLQAQSARITARLAARREDPEAAAPLFERAARLLRELALPFPLAVTLLEQGEWLLTQDRGDEAQPLLAEARETFERLEATPWIAPRRRACRACRSRQRRRVRPRPRRAVTQPPLSPRPAGASPAATAAPSAAYRVSSTPRATMLDKLDPLGGWPRTPLVVRGSRPTLAARSGSPPRRAAPVSVSIASCLVRRTIRRDRRRPLLIGLVELSPKAFGWMGDGGSRGARGGHEQVPGGERPSCAASTRARR